MDLVEVDAVGAKPAQAILHCLTNVSRARAFLAFTHLHPKLGSNQNFVAKWAEGSAQEFLAAPLPVDVGGVEKIDTRVYGRMHRGSRRLWADAPPEVVAAQSNYRYLE